MANNTLTAPVGEDVTVQKVQNYLYGKLATAGLWSGTITGYGRAYKNKTEDAEKLEWYNATESDYQDVYYDDNSDAVFFFLMGDSDDSEDGYVFKSAAKIVFMVDLSKIITGSERMDAKAHLDVMDILRDLRGKVNITGIEKGIEQVFSGIDTEGIKFNDIQPTHCFAIKVDLFYRLQC